MTAHPYIAGQLLPKETPTLAKFAWDDPFLLNDQLTEEERMIKEATASFASERLC
jgi:glutaryl-CoA dehydrogenase